MKIYNVYMLYVKLKNKYLNFINLNLLFFYYVLKILKVIFVKCVFFFRLVYLN